MDKHRRGRSPHTEVGLPEVVGFALGAGAMAKALAVLEASLSGNETARRLVREGVRAELHRVVAERAPVAADRGTTVVIWRDGSLELCRVRPGGSSSPRTRRRGTTTRSSTPTRSASR